MNREDYNENEALKAQLASMAEIRPEIMAMSLEELRAEQERIAANYRKTGRAQPRHREADLVQAHAEILAARTRNAAVSHPIAETAMAGGRQPSLIDLGRTWASNRHGPEAMAWDDHKVMAYASTPHLSEVISATANNVVLSRAGELLNVPLRLCRAVSLADYKPTSVGTLHLEAAVSMPSTALNEWEAITPMASAGQLRLKIAPLRIRFSEILLANDDVEAMSRTVEATMMAASQNEAKLFISLLTGSTNLADGQPWFGTDNSATTLAAGMAKMRTQAINGQPSDARPVFYLVPASEEAAAREAVAKMSNGNSVPLEVIPTGHLGTGAASFLFANPSIWPSCARGTMRGSNGVSLRFQPGSPNEGESSRDAILEGLHTVGFEPISRLGVVKISD